MSSSESYFNLVRDRNLTALAALLASEPVIDNSRAVHALQRAIEHRYLDVVDLYLSSGLNVNIRGEASATPLMWAAQAKNIELVDRFLRAGADVNLSDLFRMTALLYAAHMQSLKIVKRLLDAGADPGHRNIEGKSALDLARWRPFRDKDGWGVRRTTRDTPVARFLRDRVPH